MWQDEFTGPAGQPPNPTRWTYDIGTDWGNAQLEFDTAFGIPEGRLFTG